MGMQIQATSCNKLYWILCDELSWHTIVARMRKHTKKVKPALQGLYGTTGPTIIMRTHIHRILTGVLWLIGAARSDRETESCSTDVKHNVLDNGGHVNSKPHRSDTPSCDFDFVLLVVCFVIVGCLFLLWSVFVFFVLWLKLERDEVSNLFEVKSSP